MVVCELWLQPSRLRSFPRVIKMAVNFSQVGNVEVDEAFEQIKRLPQVENLDEIESELLETEEALLEVNE